jgi:hypothetical protein
MHEHHDCGCDRHPDRPIPVRVVSRDPYEYDNTPEGRARLTFDAWVLGVFIVLLVVGNILY